MSLYIFDTFGTLIGRTRATDDNQSWEVLQYRVERVQALVADGHHFALVCQEGGVGFGYTTEQQIQERNAQILSTLGLPATTPIAVCFAHADSPNERYRDPAQLARLKPHGAMIRELLVRFPQIARSDVVYVGDQRRDEEMARDAGVRFERAVECFASPIERRFHETWLAQVPHITLEREYEVTVAGKRYRIDFAHLPTKYAIELMGYEFHHRADQFVYDHQRLRDLQDAGWSVRTFAGWNIYHDVAGCVAYVRERIEEAQLKSRPNPPPVSQQYRREYTQPVQEPTRPAAQERPRSASSPPPRNRQSKAQSRPAPKQTPPFQESPRPEQEPHRSATMTQRPAASPVNSWPTTYDPFPKQPPSRLGRFSRACITIIGVLVLIFLGLCWGLSLITQSMSKSLAGLPITTPQRSKQQTVGTLPATLPVLWSARVTAKSLHVRKTPSPEGELVNKLYEGNVVDVFEETQVADGARWVRIRSKAPKVIEGWVNAQFLRKQ